MQKCRRHKWVRAWWGCDQNPGCWDTGNGAIKTVSVCARCGCKRTTVSSYCGRDRDNAVTYSAPDQKLATEAQTH